MEDFFAFDLREWRRDRLLQAGGSFTYHWIQNGKTLASVYVEVGSDELSLYYQHWNGRQWEHLNRRVQLENTRCAFGGYRSWFLCPECRRRVVVLYVDRRNIACRHCLGLGYRSQLESPLGSISKARKIRMRLGGSASLAEPFPDRPKRMHSLTYDRLREKGHCG